MYYLNRLIVLLPSKITPLSNPYYNSYLDYEVLLPSKITPLSNPDTIVVHYTGVLLPSKITPLSNTLFISVKVKRFYYPLK